jgi:hypothetical protein
MTAQEAVLDLIFGRWRSQTLHAGVKLGVFEVVGEMPKPATGIAAELGLDGALAYRLMRALGTLGLLQEDETRKFAITEAGALLRADHPESLRAMTLLEEGPEHYAIWTHLANMVRDGEQNAFVREYGHMAFDHTAGDPDYGARFNDAMSSYSNVQTALVLDALKARGMPISGHLCDIAGGHGHLLCHILAEKQALTGTVFDLPSVIDDEERLWAAKLGLTERCAFVGGDMFESIPSADIYFMKLILHDWNDDECIRILENIHRASDENARVIIVEHLITDPDTPHFSKLFDIHMMCWGTGRERSPDEYAELLARAGWRHIGTWYPESRLMGLVEGEKT